MIPMDWILGLAGGVLIGTAASIYLLISGRIMGASGILGGLVDGSGRASIAERLAFILGLVAMPVVALGFMPPAPTHATGNITLLIIAGVAVGIGTRMANGCTSGHGVCGISRFSVRGIVATIAYLFFGAVTMYIGRHMLGVI